MIRKTSTILLAVSCLLVLCLKSKAQNFGPIASAVWLNDCNQNNFFNTTGVSPNEIGPSANNFNSANFGVHTQNSGSLILRGAELRTFKNPGAVNVCSARLYYRIYLQSGLPGIFHNMSLPLLSDCDIPSGQYPSGGNCSAGDQKWNRVIPDGVSVPYSPVNLTTLAPGNYTIEIYYEITGSSTSSSLCNETVLLNNGGANYKAFFSIQAPVLASNNPTTCNGTEGLITISGLLPGAAYSVSYTDDGFPIAPANLVANGAGQVILSGLNAGIYSNFELSANGCTTNLFTGIILSNPVFTPTFTKINAFCAGTVPPVLPTISNNGLTGNWTPSVINNQASGFYTFTPTPGNCGLPLTISVTVTPNITPTFNFGTAWTVCAGGVVPALPAMSNNGITGVWSPSVVDNQNSGVYTFTPNAGPCAVPTTLTVNIMPNITPVFDFGTTLTICEGEAVPLLPALSSNGITGIWTPAIVNSMSSGTYTFTPATGQCAVNTNFAVTVMPKTTPAFSFGSSVSFCESATAPLLPNLSDNGVNGTWNPAIVSNQASGTYTFTPANGECAIPFDFTVTIIPNITPVFDFGTSLTICAGGVIPVLPSASVNGINGTWNPAVVDNQANGTYTFTPDPGSCVVPTQFIVTVTPNISPVFSFGSTQTYCAGSATPALPATSSNGITGTWSPSTVDNQVSGVYTFTPATGICATTTTLNVTIEPNVTPVFSFGPTMAICENGIVPILPNTSDNGITGTWSPSVVSNQATATYTFTPTAGLCATTATFDFTVSPNIIPVFDFGSTLSICEGGVVPVLPLSSTNGIQGTWSPAVASNVASAVYTFTPDAGLCALPVNLSITVAPNIIPSFIFGTALSICSGGTVPVLPVTSTNGIAGSWSPAVVDNAATGVYTFTPASGLCALPTTFTVNVSANAIPTFDFGTSLTICAGALVPVLPAVSLNGVAGSWSPSIVGNQGSATYTFTPGAGTCALPVTFDVTVVQNTMPVFDFGKTLTACENEIVPLLPAVSSNGIPGTWLPAVVDNNHSDVYTFTPAAGQCALSTTLTVTINPIVSPAFTFGNTINMCSGDEAPLLPAMSGNNITGVWSPSVIDNDNSATYTFTPDAGQCAVPAILVVNITPSIIPTFTFTDTIIICAGSTAPLLPVTAVNGIDGTWNPSVVNNEASATYTFTPTAAPEQCVRPVKLVVIVKPILTPLFSFGTTLNVCAGSTAPILPDTSSNGIKGTWSPAAINNQASGTYTFTTAPGQCATASAKLAVTVVQIPSVNESADTTVFDGATIPSNIFSGTPAGANFNWFNTNPSIGLPANGSGNIPSFTATNLTDAQISGTITVTPVNNGCAGDDKTYAITVKPLNKDIFVPNAFSPNGDGKNDILFVYGNYIDELEMRIFNQWGEQIEVLNSTTRGWNGTYRGKAQPVGVYVYTLKAVLSGGRKVNMKGSVTLLR